MQTVIPRPVSFSTIDGDTLAWESAVVSAGGSVSTETRQAVDQLISGLKATGLWSKVLMLDCCCGSNLTSAIVRVKVPAGVSRSYANTNFVSGDYSERGSNGGIAGGSGKYLDAGFSPFSLSGVTTSSSLGLWCYTRATGSAGTSQVSIGSSLSTTEYTVLGWVSTGSRESGVIAGVMADPPNIGSATSLTGLLGVTTNGSRANQFYASGVAVGSTVTASSNLSTLSIYAHAFNFNGSASGFSTRRLSSKLVTAGISSAEAAALNSLIVSFESALGRNV